MHVPRHFVSARGPVRLAFFRTSPINTPSVIARKEQNTAVQQLNWVKNLKFISETIPPTLIIESVSLNNQTD